ncbi:MAG TPA: PIN domain-containing protein [Thermoanaerobaculia bacterium]|nr:PIN domain-containing protein [Thermoanaerobaculia bacterium]
MIFVDSSFWIGLRNRRDAHHEEARALYPLHANAGLVTSNHVRGETWTYLRRRAGHGAGVSFLDMLERSPRLRILTVEPKQEAEALRWLRQHDEREYSFVDATSFALMRALRIREALAFDGDFAAAGFNELRP